MYLITEEVLGQRFDQEDEQDDDYENDDNDNEEEDNPDILSEQEQLEFSMRLVEEQEKKANQFINKTNAGQGQCQQQSKELSTISEKTECSYTNNNQLIAATSNTTATSQLNTNQITSWNFC